MRRVVAGVDDAGRSVLISDEQVPDIGRIWEAVPERFAPMVARIAPEDVYVSSQPPPGGAIWQMARIPPGGITSKPKSDGPMDSRGFHVHRTVDFIYVLDDGLTVELDTGTVDLDAGDVLLLQAANHAWRNRTSGDVRFLAVVMSAE